MSAEANRRWVLARIRSRIEFMARFDGHRWRYQRPRYFQCSTLWRCNEKVQPLGAVSEMNDLGLVWVQLKPQIGQDRTGPTPCLLDPRPGRADDDKVIGVTDQHPETAALAFPCLVETVERDVGQQR